MTKQVTRMAGAVAAATSRRGFLGRLARLAAGAAAAAAGLLAVSTAHASPGKGPNGGKPTTYCCLYGYGGEEAFTVCTKSKGEQPCPPKWGESWLLRSVKVERCRECSVEIFW